MEMSPSQRPRLQCAVAVIAESSYGRCYHLPNSRTFPGAREVCCCLRSQKQARHSGGYSVHMTTQAETTALKYRVLAEMCRAIAFHRDLSEIFADLSQFLSELLPFHYVSVLLHDDEKDVMRMHVLHSPMSRTVSVGDEFAMEESPSGLVWNTQEILNCPDIEKEKRFTRVAKLLQESGVRSFCALPLTTAHNRMGAMAFGRAETGGFDADEIEFATLVSNHVAVALENAMHYRRSSSLQRELTRERDRLQLVLDLNNAVVSNLELRALFTALSTSLRRIIGYDSASLMLPEGDNALRLHALDFPGGRGYLQQDMLLPINETRAGRAFRTGQTLLVGTRGLPYNDNFDIEKIRIGEGFRSLLMVPLVMNQGSVGVLTLGSRQENAFSNGDLEFATQIGRQIAIAVNNALQHRALSESKDQISEQKSYLEEEIRAEQDFEDIVGLSRPLRDVLGQVETVAPTDSTVLICGETGTGKELIARAIHERSARRQRTFIKINCAAIPLGLLESELFGHEKGAFTGAISRKIGRFELAHQGTLFLDEIGDIPPELQPKLLRVLQEQEFERLGSIRTQRVDVRVIAATNQDIGKMVNEGTFRRDLFYRVNVFPINVPPLRDRVDDIPLLVRYFTSKYARRMNKRIDSIPTQTIRALTEYSWPGNVRELQNFIERAVILSSRGELRAPTSELKVSGTQLVPIGKSKGETLQDVERQHILRALEQANWVVGGPSGAAVRLGIKRTTLLYRMEKLGITREESAAS